MTEMDQKFIDYLNSLGLSITSIERVKSIYQFYTDLCKVKITDIFISEYVDGENKRTFESLWLFSDSYIMEAKNFISEDTYDMVYRNNVDRWELKKRDYDFKTTSRMSRLTIDLSFRRENLSGTFKASGDNCSNLLTIFQRYVMTNFRT